MDFWLTKMDCWRQDYLLQNICMEESYEQLFHQSESTNNLLGMKLKYSKIKINLSRGEIKETLN